MVDLLIYSNIRLLITIRLLVGDLNRDYQWRSYWDITQSKNNVKCSEIYQ